MLFSLSLCSDEDSLPSLHGAHELTHVPDCFMSCCPCTAPCTECQELRTVPVSDWDWLGQMRSETGFVGYLPDWELFPVDENRRNSATNATPNDAMLEHDDSAKHV